METKSILVSKTMWTNFVYLVFIVVGMYFFPVPMEAVEPLVIISLPLVNIFLRKITKAGVHI